jgi:PST family polysaccharide transporter
MLTGVGWAVVTVASAPLMSRIFHSDTVGLITAVSAGTIVLHALTYVPDALMQRRFDFRQRLIVQPVVGVTFAVTSVALCATGFGVWGLVIGSYCSILAWLVATWALAGWRPGAAGRPSFTLWRELAKFSLPLVVWTVVNRARDLLETAVVGGALNSTALGYYRYGRRLGALPEMAVIEVGSYVLFPAFSRLAGDPIRFRSAFLRALQVLWCLMAAVAFFIVAVGEPLVTVLLGEKWRGAGVMLVALAGIGPGVALMAVGMESIKGVGRTRLLHWVTLVTTALGIGLLFVLLPFGVAGVGLALSISSRVVGVLSLLLARPLAGVSPSASWPTDWCRRSWWRPCRRSQSDFSSTWSHTPTTAASCWVRRYCWRRARDTSRCTRLAWRCSHRSHGVSCRRRCGRSVTGDYQDHSPHLSVGSPHRRSSLSADRKPL